MATPLMVITNAGLAAASVASPTGPFIDIVEFRLGSAFGYTPSPTDTGMNGTTLFTTTPSSYANVGDNTIDVVCKLGAEAGPFNYGEISLWLQDTSGNKVMFSKAVFDTLQAKYSSLGTNVAVADTFHCLIKLVQSTAIFQFSTITNQQLLEVNFWSDVVAPSSMSSSGISLILVKELDAYNCSSLLHKSSGDKWTVGTNYSPYVSTTVSNASTTWIDVPASDFSVTDLTSENRKYVVELITGEQYRSVTSVVSNGATYRLSLNPTSLAAIPSNGSQLRVYINDNDNTRFPPISTDAGNIVTIHANGLYAQTVIPISPDSLNTVSMHGNGLYSRPPVSTNAGNLISLQTNGLYASVNLAPYQLVGQYVTYSGGVFRHRWNGSTLISVDGVGEWVDWNSGNFNPAAYQPVGSYATRGAQVQRAVGVTEFGSVDANPESGEELYDLPAPWVLVGLRVPGATIYLRGVWLVNQ